MGRAGGHRPKHIGGLLIAEFLALAVALTVVGSAVTDRIALAAAVIAVTATIVGQGPAPAPARPSGDSAGRD